MANGTPGRPALSGRYGLYGRIGSGGMATVHLGRFLGQGQPGPIVAIKRLRPHFAEEPEVIASFADEARLAGRARHPNVVAILDVAAQDGEVLLVMEYIDGLSLAALTCATSERGELVPQEIAVTVVASALRGLHAAHEARSEAGLALNIVHRDVSPQNILVGVDGVARIADFGVAKARGRQQTTRDGSIKGKLGYMAPEQLAGRGVTRRTDLFAAAVVLWELLTGARLFQRAEDAETLTRTLFEKIPPPSRLRASVLPGLDSIVMQALERDPSRRFATAEDMATALTEAVPPAAAGAIGEWLRGLCADELEKRSRLVAAIESGACVPEEIARGGDSERTSRETSMEQTPARTESARNAAGGRRRRLGVLVAIALAGLGVPALLAVRSSRGRAQWLPPRVEGAAIPPLAAEPPTSAVEPAAEPPTVASNDVSSSAAVPASSSSAPASNRLHAASPRRPSQAAAKSGAPAAAPVGSARDRLYSRD